MLTRVGLMLLFCAAVVEPIIPDICGKQPCHPPLRCRTIEPGTSVCVRDPPPTCAATSCPTGQECVLMQILCKRLPCDPKPYCVTKNPCRFCSEPTKFCHLAPFPICRFVIEPTCENRLCKPWQKCEEVPVLCLIPPCPVSLVCKDEW